jgi:predicted NAD-dependent protein-ADP-ribosyltransferase YbiA (DUF1768 family)
MKKIFIGVFAFLILSCVSSSKMNSSEDKAEYNDSWWTPVTNPESWEIPPQAADRSQNQVVLSKRTELGVFSNLADSPLELDGQRYQSIEGLWQGMKYPEDENDERHKAHGQLVQWPYTREQVYQMSGFESKHAGDQANEIMKKIGINWVTYKGKKIEYKGQGQADHYKIIFAASMAKVEQNPLIKQLLFKTKGLSFLLDHTQAPNSPAAYRTELIYMKIRDEDLSNKSGF